ncbi:hypothetical protein BH10ACT2_BH10ACT2_16520 [soil metagenome]
MKQAEKQAGKRPFWAHQLVEYILGLALVASGLQSPTPLVPAAVGGFLLLYSGATRGAMAAFRLIDRRVHRVADPILVVVQIAAALQPWLSVDNATRIVMIGIAVVHLVVWLGSSFSEKEKKPKVPRPHSQSQPAEDRSTEFGRSAGRFAAKGVRAVRTAKAKREGK